LALAMVGAARGKGFPLYGRSTLHGRLNERVVSMAADEVEFENAMVFVVDDDDAVRDSLRLLLESYGMTVEDYASAEAFGAGYRPCGRDCLILDHNLPGASGLDFLASAQGRGLDLPVILVTGQGDSAIRARALQLGVAAYLEKPVADDALVDAIRVALDGRFLPRT